MRSDAHEYLKADHENTELLIQKKIAYIVEYAQHDVFLGSTMMRKIVSVVNGVGKDHCHN